ncbi:MAG: hypothetical protein KDJ39_16545 [Gammaproteobacteria bacterium]|nr:hypothetical protein [Gammaproteobacteria bacterium]
MTDPLDLVLAGPIIRRVEPRLVAIWVALSQTALVSVRVWHGLQTASATVDEVASGQQPIADAVAATRRFGENLHVALVVVKIEPPKAPLEPGTLYSYDVNVGLRGLKQLGMLRDENPGDIPDELKPFRAPALALGYVEDRLPSFVTPPATIDDTHFAHCSCRKSHGPGYDALAWLDKEIEDNLATPRLRPQQLFMTGDQIYADDLPPSLLAMLGDIAARVIGDDEQLHVVGKTAAGNAVDAQVTANLDNFPALRRHKVVIELAGYTTGDGENHLLSYGEYVAMYLAVWNPRIWGRLGTPDDLMRPIDPNAASATVQPFWGRPEDNKKYGGDAGRWRDAARLPGSGFNGMDRELAIFRAGVPHVARLLANVATYMVFDDHDVTDDWNISKKWVNRCYTKPMGRQLIRNALMAYAVFQGWGNDPKTFESGSNLNFLNEITRLYGGGQGPYPNGSTDFIDTLVGTSGTDFTIQPTWKYSVPSPTTLMLVLDTRTRRKFEGQSYLPPDLVGLDRDRQIPAGPLSDGRELLFMVSAAPVLGPDTIDRLGWPIAQLAIDAVHTGKGLDGSGVQTANVGVEKYDNEGWSSNELAREVLFQRLATYPSVVMLGGDVHFSCSLALDYYRKDKADPNKTRASRFVELTSSPARNSFKAVVKLLVRQNPFLQVVETGFAFAQLAWAEGPAPITLPADGFVSPGRRSRIRRSPALLPANDWPPDTGVQPGKPPDWRWRLRVLRDPRHEAELPTSLRQPQLDAAQELDVNDALPAYRAVAMRQQTMAATRFDFLREMVFHNTVGLVRIRKQLDADNNSHLELTHVLLSEDAPDSVSYAEGTHHVVDLTPGIEPPPELETREPAEPDVGTVVQP